MATFAKIPALLIASWYFLTARSADAQLYIEEWHRSYPKGKIYNHGPFLATEDNSFAYGVCDSDEYRNPNCQLIREKKLSEDIIFRKTCKIPIDRDDWLFLWPVTLNNNGKHLILSCKLLLQGTLTNQCHTKIRSVDMTNCKVKVSTTDILSEGFINFAWYPNSFEIFYISNSSSGCLEAYRTMFDAEGNRVSQPSLVMAGENFTATIMIYPVQPDSPAQGYFVTYVYTPDLTINNDFIAKQYFLNFPEDDKKIKILHIDSKGKGKVLLNKMVENNKERILITGSNANDLLGVCWADRTACKKIECYQYDQHFNLVLNETFTFVTRIRLHKIHNLPDGGFLLLLGNCLNSTECANIEVFRVEADGTRDRSIEISGFKYVITREQEPIIEIIETAKKEFCFYIYNKEETRAQYARTCFPKRYLL